MSINDNNGGQYRPDVYEQLETASVYRGNNSRNDEENLYHKIDSIADEIRDFLNNESDIKDAVEDHYRYNRHKT